MSVAASVFEGWLRVRRFAVPRWMIEAATVRRLAGDWRGACAVANVEVNVDLPAIGRDHGRAVAESVEDDLRYLAPDLLRWHVDRLVPRSTAPCRGPTVLCSYPGGHLQVAPRYGGPGPRLVLRFAGPADPRRGLHASRERWDTRRTGDLLARHGGRLPFLSPSPPGAAEEIIALQDAGEWRKAWCLAGFDIDALADASPLLHEQIRTTRFDLTTLAATARELGRPEALIDLNGECLWIDGFRRRVWCDGERGDIPQVLPMARVERPIDHDLVRLGKVSLDELHPLAAAALVAGYGNAAGPRPTVDMSLFTVRCGSARHDIGPDGIPHSAEEIEREKSLYALGGPEPTGCFAVHIGWHNPSVTLPEVLRRRRSTLEEQTRHGDGPALTDWLDAGLDPHLRTDRGRTILHLIVWLPDPAPLLARLLAAGLDIEAHDRYGDTPLRYAIESGGSIAAIRALAEAGATTDGWEDAAERAGRSTELRFLSAPRNPGKRTPVPNDNSSHDS